MAGRKLSVLAAGAALLCGCLATYGKRPVQEHLLDETGADVLDCGRIREESAPKAALGVWDCAARAYERKKAFWFREEHPGVDSSVTFGLLGRRDGSVARYVYDSAPCGGPRCRESFKVTPCRSVRVVREPPFARLVCEE